jgi:hypothetical protein
VKSPPKITSGVQNFKGKMLSSFRRFFRTIYKNAKKIIAKKQRNGHGAFTRSSSEWHDLKAAKKDRPAEEEKKLPVRHNDRPYRSEQLALPSLYRLISAAGAAAEYAGNAVRIVIKANIRLRTIV